MSLYDDTARALAASGSATATASSMLDNALGGVRSAATAAMGGGRLAQAVSTIGVGMAKNAAMSALNRAIPPGKVRNLTTGINIAGSLMQGDVEGAGLQLLDSGLLRDILPGMDGVASQARYWGRPTPLFGGISPTEAKRIHDEIRTTRFARKNLFLLEVSSELQGNISDRFNLFATDVAYAPQTVSGEKAKVGSATIDLVTSSEPVELRVTTKDDVFGSLRTWFQYHAAVAAPPDGTVGVPARYAIRIKVVHSIISRSALLTGGYENIGLYRPANIENDLSRRDDNLEEIQMAFSQLDTFMAP